MSQKAIQFSGSPLPGATLITEVTDILKSLASNRKGSARPSDIQTGETWLDDANNPEWVLKLYDGSEDITILTIDTSGNSLSLAGYVIGQDVQAYDAAILKANISATLSKGFLLTPVEAAATPLPSSGGMQYKTMVADWNLPLLTETGALVLNLSGNYVLTPHASYKRIGDDYDYSVGGGATVVLMNDGTTQVCAIQNWSA